MLQSRAAPFTKYDERDATRKGFAYHNKNCVAHHFGAMNMWRAIDKSGKLKTENRRFGDFLDELLGINVSAITSSSELTYVKQLT
ncbi:hypothetical protein [Corynebacterium lactis]|uniref:hypothetical protein n=1 Tax=Corynebacterium lactis TaxID=1231000 RepID=UPI0012E28F2E|nr:hypothetical protein [Corynebacterium lactis]